MIETLQHSFRGSLVFVVALLCGVGCAQRTPSSASESTPDVGASYQALAVQLQNCASNALDCYQAASCDEAQEQVCRDQMDACREETRAAYRAYFEALQGCFQSKLECVRDAVSADGGAWSADGGVFGALEGCGDAFRDCAEAERPIPPEPGPCMASLRTCMQGELQGGGHASRGAIHDCFAEAHACVAGRLPMCEPGDADAGGVSVDAGSAP